MNLSIVIPTWNAWDLLEPTLKALQSALAPLAASFEVLVVDDGGSDETAQKVRERYPDIQLIRRSENGGFSAACNTGIRRARGEWVLLLNNDMRPEPSALADLMTFADTLPADVFAVRPRIVRGVLLSDEDYRHMAMQPRLRFGMLRLQLVCMHEETSHKKAFPVCSGGAGLFRRKMLEELHGLDEIYSPYYWEDVDLSWRALSRGWYILYASEAVFVHEQEGSIKRSQSPARVRRIAQRNAYLFHWLNLQDWRWLIAHAAYMPLHLLAALLRGHGWHLRGWLDALLYWREVRHGRRARQLTRRQSDRDIQGHYVWGHVGRVWQR